LIEIFWRLGERFFSSSRYNGGVSLKAPENQEHHAETNAHLRSLLRRFPYWAAGHKRLAELSFAKNDIATAYASAQALRTLAGGDSEHTGQAHLFLGRAFLTHGDWQSSLQHLERAGELLPHNPRVWEERAAAHMAGENYAEAYQILSTVPSSYLTAEGKAALEFLAARVQGS
jgi:Flp pilus assembly protein TadD